MCKLNLIYVKMQSNTQNKKKSKLLNLIKFWLKFYKKDFIIPLYRDTIPISFNFYFHFHFIHDDIRNVDLNTCIGCFVLN